MNILQLTSSSVEDTVSMGEQIGARLEGGELIELLSDLGGGKTTLVQGIARGFGATDPVSSPSFTICNTYARPDGKQINHFDFYRLSEAGIMKNELDEYIHDATCVVVVEWGAIVHDILPDDRIVITIRSNEDDTRSIECKYPSKFSDMFAGIAGVAV